MRFIPRSGRYSTVLSLFVLAAAAELPTAVRAAEPIRCVASIAPVAFVVQDAGGSAVHVTTLLPPGASPHGYEAGPETIRAAANAEVAFFIGRNLDEWAEAVVRGAGDDASLVRLGEDLPGPEPLAEEHDDHGHGGGHDHGGGLDPHVWLDPAKMSAMAEHVRVALTARRPDLAEPLLRSTERAVRSYARIDSLCRVRLAPVRATPFVAYHGGMNHLVARYGLSQVAILEPFPGREPSPRYMKQVVLTIRQTGARVVFSEPQISTRLAEVVGSESGIPVVVVDVLGGLPGRTTYEGLMHSMLDTLAGALGPKGER